MDDPYATLGVTREHSLAEIKQAFHKLAHQHHPDKGGDLATFQKISGAWAFLKESHIQRPKAPPRTTTYANGKHTDSVFGKVFYEYDTETHRWYSHEDLDTDGYVVPTTITVQTREEFLQKVAEVKLRKEQEKRRKSLSTPPA